MQTAQSQNQSGWTRLSGRILEGGYELQDLLEADTLRAVFKVRVLGDRELDCVATFFQLPEAESSRQVEIWESVRSLRDPNLSAPLGAGKTDVGGSMATYVVTRRPDETLGGVLRERALAPAEAVEAFLTAARGLESLHLNGFAHGSLAPEQVLAIGNSIKLSSESARVLGVAPAVELIPAKYVAPESEKFNLTSEADIWCLGAALFESLTEKVWTKASAEEASALREPFATVVLRCLEDTPANRCKLPEAVGLLKGQITPAPRVRAKSAAVSSPSNVVVPTTELQAAASEKAEHVISLVPKTEPSPSPKQEPVPSSGTGVAAVPTTTKTSVEAQAKSATLHAVPKSAPKPVAVDRPTEARVAPEKALPVARVTPPSSPAVTLPAPRPIEPQKRTEGDDEPAAKIWIWAGVALLVVLALLWALRPKTQTKPVGPTQTSPVAANRPAAAKPAGNAWETRTLQPDGTASKPAAPVTPERSSSPTRSAPAKAAQTAPAMNHAEAKASTKPASGAVKGDVWRVILYTYNQREKAEAKAQDLNAKHASLHAEVFSPSDNGPYLITAGGGMSREEAVETRRKALGSGMPRDSYLQNYAK